MWFTRPIFSVLFASAATIAIYGGPAQGDAAVSGQVVDTSAGTPLADALVTLSSPGAGALRLQVTDQQGRFVFSRLAASEYGLLATRPGFSDGRAGTPDAGTVRFHLAPRAWLRDVRIQLERLGSIRGHISDELGLPLVGAHVRLLRPFQFGGRRLLASGPVTLTDDNGEYRFADLRPGPYLVVVPAVQQSIGDSQVPDAGDIAIDSTGRVLGRYPEPGPLPDGRLGVFPVRFFPDASAPEAATVVQVSGGQESVDIDLRLPWTAAVRVCGQIESGKALQPGLVLRLMPRGLEHLGTGSEAATTVARRDGSFCFARVPSGDYSLLVPGSTFEFSLAPPTAVDRSLQVVLPRTAGVSRRGPAGAGLPLFGFPGITYGSHLPELSDGGFAGVALTEVSVGDRDVTNLGVRLEPTGRIEGSIVYSEGTDQRVRGALEIAEVSGNPQAGARFASIASDTQTFAAPALVAGDYVLRFPTSDLTVVAISADGVDVTRATVRVNPGTKTDVTVTLDAKPLTISGRIQDASGTPVLDAAVLAFSTDRRLWSGYGFTPTWIRVVGTADGTFQMTRLRPGEYYLAAIPADTTKSWADPAFLGKLALRAIRVTLAPGDVVNRNLSVIIFPDRD